MAWDAVGLLQAGMHAKSSLLLSSFVGEGINKRRRSIGSVLALARHQCFSVYRIKS
jgi:hypothetical protein